MSTLKRENTLCICDYPCLYIATNDVDLENVISCLAGLLADTQRRNIISGIARSHRADKMQISVHRTAAISICRRRTSHFISARHDASRLVALDTTVEIVPPVAEPRRRPSSVDTGNRRWATDGIDGGRRNSRNTTQDAASVKNSAVDRDATGDNSLSGSKGRMEREERHDTTRSAERRSTGFSFLLYSPVEIQRLCSPGRMINAVCFNPLAQDAPSDKRAIRPTIARDALSRRYVHVHM